MCIWKNLHVHDTGHTLDSLGEIKCISCIVDSPQLYNKDDDPLIFYSDLDQSVTLEVTVRAFPDFTDIDSAFDWKRVDGKALSNISETESVKVDAEVFLTKVTIGNVTEQDLGEYVVTADNGIRGPVDFLVVLYLTGKTGHMKLVQY